MKTEKRQGGRPSRLQAEQIEGTILDAARDLFFSEGYGATSIEKIARKAGISKRTFYHRFEGKAAVFEAVVRRLMAELRPAQVEGTFAGDSLEPTLEQVAHLMLHAALMPQALALQRLILAEAPRFPELALVMNEQGARREAVTRIAALLEREKNPDHPHDLDPLFAAEQFLQMVVTLPQRRASGLGQPMTEPELKGWASATVRLFLHGCRGRRSG